MKLRQLDNPIWEAGYNAYHDGLKLEDNPYFEDDERFEMWESGFECADADDDS